MAAQIGHCNGLNVSECDYWTDITGPGNEAWITSQALDSHNGDACGSCPCDPTNDVDKDRKCGAVCAQGTPGCPQRCAALSQFPLAIDNCPNVYNPTQENCNLDAEQAHGVDVLGDACDPVPCPTLDTSMETDEVRCTPNPPPNENSQTCLGIAVHDTALINTVGSHPRTGVQIGAPAITPPSDGIVIPGVITTSRYCQARDASQVVFPQKVFNCHNPLVMNDNELTEVGNDQTPLSPWHGITTTLPVEGTVHPNQFYAFQYGSENTSVQWLYNDDLPGWLSNLSEPTIPLPADDPMCQGHTPMGTSFVSNCLNGTIWFHAYTNVGSNSLPQNEIVRGQDVGVHAAELANSFSDITPASLQVAYCPTETIEQQVLYAAARQTASQPSPIVVWPVGILRPGFDVGGLPDSQYLVDSSIGVAALEDDGKVVATQNLGSANCGGSSLTARFTGTFSAQHLWLNVVEPDARIGDRRKVIALLLSSDGTQLEDAALVNGNSLAAMSQCGRCNTDRFCDNLECEPDDVIAPQTTPVTPTPRTNFVAFYSRSANAAVVAGGRNQTSGAVNQDVWFYDLGVSAWREITPAGSDFGQILDGTYSFRDGRIWILDRKPGRWGLDAIRLTRFDEYGSHFEVMEQWPVAHFLDANFTLSLDRDGALLLTSMFRNSYALTRVAVRPDGKASAHVVDVGIGELAFRPVVSNTSYSFLFRRPDGSGRIVRKAKLSACDDEHEDDHDRRAVAGLFR